MPYRLEFKYNVDSNNKTRGSHKGPVKTIQYLIDHSHKQLIQLVWYDVRSLGH